MKKIDNWGKLKSRIQEAMQKKKNKIKVQERGRKEKWWDEECAKKEKR